MAKKEIKQIRVVYFPGDSVSHYYDHSRERLELQFWSEQDKSWCLKSSLPFTFSREWTQDTEPNYIHFSLLKTICNLAYDGWELVGWFNVNDLDD